MAGGDEGGPAKEAREEETVTRVPFPRALEKDRVLHAFEKDKPGLLQIGLPESW